MRARSAILALAAVLAVGCGRCSDPRKPKSAPAPRPVAVVNGEPIPAEALARELREGQAGTSGASPAADKVKRELLDELVERTLLLQEARARSITVGQDQLERALLKLRADYPGTHFDDLLAQERLSQTELKARLKEQLVLERLFETEVFPHLEVTPAEIQAFYDAHAKEFEDPEAVRVLQIVVTSKDQAQALRDKLRANPQTFAELARKNSIAPEAKNGGDLGLIGKGAGFPEVFDLCFTLPLNTVSEVTPSPYGFHLFKVVERRAAQRRPLEKATSEIREKLLRDKRTQAKDEYVAGLRKRAQITYDENAIAAVTP